MEWPFSANSRIFLSGTGQGIGPNPNIPTTSHKVTGDAFRMQLLVAHLTMEVLYSGPDRTFHKD